MKEQRAALPPLNNERLTGRRVLVTGAAGSIGSALCKQLATLNCEALAVLDHLDHGLLDVAEALSRASPQLPVVEVLCDIRNRRRLEWGMERFRPDVVVHTAALKHVHMGDRHPVECVLTNLFGTRNVAEAAAASGAREFLFVSTDKAAAPSCVMGASKRLAEMYLRGFQHDHSRGMKIHTVRFGNVFGSQGSVAPRFQAQIDKGGPVEVTHPDMERFFVTEAFAIEMLLRVLCAPDLKDGTFIFDMGKTVRILDLAREMIAKSGRPCEIEFTGVRAGEKLTEVLYDEHEQVSETAVSGLERVVPRLAQTGTLSDVHLAVLEKIAEVSDGADFRDQVFALLRSRLGTELATVGERATQPPSLA